MGPSGSGKSTMLNILGLLDTPTSGNYYLDGKEVSKLTGVELSKTRGRKIGFIFQTFNLLSYMSAQKNVELGLKYGGKDDYELASEGLEFAKKALERKPRLLILDEINLAAHFGIVKTEDILKLLEEIPEETTVVLTGRRAPGELVERADLVTEMKFVKHPFEKKVPAREGLEY